MVQECVWCNSPSPLGLRCSKCKVVFYCSQECQKQHWTSGHKGQCGVLSTNNQEYIQSSKAKGDDFKFPTRYLFPPKRVAQMLEFKQDINVGAGLHNIGNTCFMNSVLQSLLYTPGFTNYILSGDHSRTCTIEGFCMACLMEKHAYQVLTQPGGTVVPREIFFNLKKIGDFQLLTQEDAHEFYDQVLDRLHTSFLRNSKTEGEKVDPLTEGTTLMRQLFGGYLQNQVQCSECKSVSRTYEPFTTLPISLSPSSTSVEQELLAFTSIERMSEDIGYKCENCNKKVAADKQLLVRVAPPILALSLKRFDFTHGGSKIDKPLIFHNELLLDAIYPKENQNENENFKYVLYALVVHFGQSAYSGHYVAFVKISDKWLLFDDAKVYEVSPAVVLKQKAYMLFYKREKMDEAQHQLLKQQFQRSATTTASGPSTKQTNPNNLNMANLHISPSSSSSPSPTSPPANRIPSFKVFYRNAAESEEEIVDFVLRVHLPALVSTEKLIVSAGSQGSLKLIVPAIYHLDITIPFSLDTENSKGYFFLKNSFLFVLFPVCHDITKVKASSIVKVTLVKKEEEAPVDLHVNSEHEIDVTPNKMVLPKKTQEEVKAQERESENNAKKDESTYVGLYHHVREWMEHKKKGEERVEGRGKGRGEVGEAKKGGGGGGNKVGRNDMCPCGSGRKYKMCHGQA